jgi:hypothetical protein
MAGAVEVLGEADTPGDVDHHVEVSAQLGIHEMLIQDDGFARRLGGRRDSCTAQRQCQRGTRYKLTPHRRASTLATLGSPSIAARLGSLSRARTRGWMLDQVRTTCKRASSELPHPRDPPPGLTRLGRRGDGRSLLARSDSASSGLSPSPCMCSPFGPRPGNPHC